MKQAKHSRALLNPLYDLIHPPLPTKGRALMIFHWTRSVPCPK